MLIGGLVCSFVTGLGYAAWEDTGAGRRYGSHVMFVFTVVTLAVGDRDGRCASRDGELPGVGI